jgi:dihydrophenazinedicarboxylate synthase
LTIGIFRPRKTAEVLAYWKEAAMSNAGTTLATKTLSGDVSAELPEFDRPPANPIALLRAWIDGAGTHGVREPLALALATVGVDGVPSTRIVLLKSLDETGLVFTSHFGSHKGRDIAANPQAAATLYWRETVQQINVAGRVERLSDAESDVLFAERPRAAQATTAVSEQSARLADESELRARAAALTEGGEIARPQGWGGYRLVIEQIEFWHGSPDRLHRRLQYHREGGDWTAMRLQP